MQMEANNPVSRLFQIETQKLEQDDLNQSSMVANSTNLGTVTSDQSKRNSVALHQNK